MLSVVSQDVNGDGKRDRIVETSIADNGSKTVEDTHYAIDATFNGTGTTLSGTSLTLS